MKTNHMNNLVALMVFVGLILCPYAEAQNLAPQDFQNKYNLTLLQPKIDGLKVELNGVHNLGENTASEWSWGDGSAVEISRFPSLHIYPKPGNYKITVTVRKVFPEGTVEKKATTSIVVKKP